MSTKQLKSEADLYGLFLELSFTVECREDQIKDLEDELKAIKKQLKLNVKKLEIVKARYKEVFGKEPNFKRGK